MKLTYDGKWSSETFETLDNEFMLFCPAKVTGLSLSGEGEGTVTAIMPSGTSVQSPLESGICSLSVEEDIEAFSPIRFSVDDSVIITQIEILFD